MTGREAGIRSTLDYLIKPERRLFGRQSMSRRPSANARSTAAEDGAPA